MSRGRDVGPFRLPSSAGRLEQSDAPPARPSCGKLPRTNSSGSRTKSTLIAEVDRERPGACEQWSVKDLLAHLDAWHELFLGWEAEGSDGGKPAMPAPGFTWAQTPKLNADIHARTVDDRWNEVVDGGSPSSSPNCGARTTPG